MCFSVRVVLYTVFFRPSSLVHCIYGFILSLEPGQNAGQKPDQKPGQKSGPKSGHKSGAWGGGMFFLCHRYVQKNPAKYTPR